MLKANLVASLSTVGSALCQDPGSAGKANHKGTIVSLGLVVTLAQITTAILFFDIIADNPLAANTAGICVAFLLWSLYGSIGPSRAGLVDPFGPGGWLIVSIVGFLVSNLAILLVVRLAGLSFLTGLVANLVIVPATYLLAAGRFGSMTSVPRATRQTISIAVATTGFAVVMSQYLINQDTSWILYASHQWLNGAVLYRDVMELNPPLVFYLMVPAVLLARLTGLGDGVALICTLSTVIFVALIWVRSLLERNSQLTDRQKTGLLLAAAFALLVQPINLVGQREHFAVVLSLPYLLALTLHSGDREPSRPEWTMLAAFAWFGLALKPFFFLIPLMISVVAAWQERRWQTLFSAANWTLAVLCAGYLVLIGLVHDAYIDTIIPMVTEVYFAYGRSALAVLVGGKFIEFIFLLLFLAALSYGKRDNLVLWRFVVWCVAGMLIYLLQFKGWISHLLPFTSAIILTVGWVSVTATRTLVTRVLLGVLALSLVASHLIQGVYKPSREPGLMSHLPEKAQETSFVVWTSVMWMSFPLANESGATWASRYPSQWLIPGAVLKLSSSPCADHGPTSCSSTRSVLDYARRTGVDDLIKYKPETVFVDNQSRKTGFGDATFDYIEFFSGDPRFKDQWAHYKIEAVLPKVDVWIRRNAGHPSEL